jgi:hypothetical protein
LTEPANSPLDPTSDETKTTVPLRQRLLVQAQIPPLDEDGVIASAVGTVMFGIASAIAWWQHDWLIAHDRLWWLAVALTGVVIGLLLLGYTTRRRALAAARSQSSAVDSTTEIAATDTTKTSESLDSPA